MERFPEEIVEHYEQEIDEGRRITRGLGQLELLRTRNLPAAQASFDAVLLLGPLYHLTERADRVRALSEAARVVGPGGVVFAAAISRFASLFDGLAREFLFDPEFRAIVERDLREGQHRNPRHRPHWFTTAFFHHPEELRAEVAEAGLEVVELVGVEGLAGSLPQLGQRWESDRDRELSCGRPGRSRPSRPCSG